MRRSFKYKVKMHATARRNAEWQLARLCELYNAALEERREAWRVARKSISFYDQCRQLKEIKQVRPEYVEIGSQVLECCLKRLDEAFQAFYRRAKAGQRPGYPRFKSAKRFDSLTFRSRCGWKLAGRHLTMQGIGTIKLFLSREIEGSAKTVTLKRDACGDWWAIFSCEGVAARPLPDVGADVGIDLGLAHYAALSTGEVVDNPRPLYRAEVKLRLASRRVSKRQRGSRRRKVAQRRLAKHHRKTSRVRRDFQWKLAKALVIRFDRIAVEDLNVAGLARGRMARPIYDAAWGEFLHALTTKAEEAAREIVFVNARGTSQACSECGCVVAKDLRERVHQCEHCGVTLDRDVNAARNIRARAGLAASRPRSQAAA